MFFHARTEAREGGFAIEGFAKNETKLRSLDLPIFINFNLREAS